MTFITTFAVIFTLSTFPYQNNAFLTPSTHKNAILQTKPSLPFLPMRIKMQNDPTDVDATTLIQRTLYRLNPSISSFLDANAPGTNFQIEERIAFEYKDDDAPPVPIGNKEYIIRGKPSDEAAPTAAEGPRRRYTRIGPELHRFNFSEADIEDGTSPGTGATTWDASIVQSLFFASRPDLLNGRVLELGSGVGFGGLTACIAASLASTDGFATYFSVPNIKSLTLTDSETLVLKQCIINAKNTQLKPPEENVHIHELNWYNPVPPSIHQSYDTVLAADCAYLYPDIPHLARTIAYLLSTNEDSGRFFVFAPFHRDAIRDLQTELERRYRMNVNLGLLEVEKIDLEPLILRPNEDVKEEDSPFCPLRSKKTLEFLLLEGEHDESFIGEGEMFFRGRSETDDRDDRYTLEPEAETNPWK